MTESVSVDSDCTATDAQGPPSYPSIVAGDRRRKINGYMVVVLTAIAACIFVYLVTSASKQVAAPAAARLTEAPRKRVPELKPEPKPEFPAMDLPLDRSGSPVQPPTDPLKILQQQLDLQRTEKSRQLLEARLKSALDPGRGSESGRQSGSDSGTGLGIGAGIGPGSQSGGGQNNERSVASFIPDLKMSGYKTAASQILADDSGQDKNASFANAAAGLPVPLSKASSVTDPEHKILQGKIIDAILLPRIISDLPGTVCALTQRDVYAERGHTVLIPWGSRMCGVYNSELKKGQNRLFTIWNTLRVANVDGSITEVALDSVGSDQLGSAGTGGLVDTHFAEIFGTSALLSIIGAGAANMAVGPEYQNYSAAQYRTSVQQAAAQTAQSVLAPYVNIPPTVTVPAGTRIRIFVNRDLDFSVLVGPAMGAANNAVSNDLFE